MFMRVKQGSLVEHRRELGHKLGLGSHIDPTIIDPTINHRYPAVLPHSELGVGMDDLDDKAGFYEVLVTHR